MLAPIKASFSTLSIDPPFLSDPRRIFTVSRSLARLVARVKSISTCAGLACASNPLLPLPRARIYFLSITSLAVSWQHLCDLTSPFLPPFENHPLVCVVIKFFFSFIFVTMPWVSCCRWIFSTICYLVAARAGAWTRQRRREKEFFKIWFAHRISNYFLRDLIHIYMCVTDFPFIEWRAVDQRSKSTA